MLSFTATALEGGADRAAASSVASIVSSDCRSVSSQTTVRASNIVTPKAHKKMTNVPESPPRTVEDLWQLMLLRDEQQRLLHEQREVQQRQRDEQREVQQRQRDEQRDQQLDELVLQGKALNQQVNALNQQVNTLNQQVQALVGTAGGRQQRDSPSHRHDNSGSCCGFLSRFQAHRHQGAVVGPLDQDEQNSINAMVEPLEIITNRQETLINADVFVGPASASLASSTGADAGSQRLSALSSPSQGPASRGTEFSSDGPDGNPASVTSRSSPPPPPAPVIFRQ
jgi:hypothetical protein